MPSEKTARSAERKRLRNRRVRATARTIVTRANNILQRSQFQDAEPAVAHAVKLLDGAVTKGIIHRNNAARKKSRLMAKLNALKAS